MIEQYYKLYKNNRNNFLNIKQRIRIRVSIGKVINGYGKAPVMSSYLLYT